MRKILFAALGAAILAGAGGFAGYAVAQSQGGAPGAQHAARGHQGFFEADANSDGAVTRQEFDASRGARFTQMDANGDGQLAREEMRGSRGEGGERRGRRGGMHSLERADANSDGSITREEFLAQPAEMFDRLDENHDGVISTDERPQRGDRAQGERRAGNPDADGDRQVSRDEFATRGASLFQRMDANSDGRVTREEAEAARPRRAAD